MDPLSAVGLAANIIQFTQFTGQLVAGTYDIYRSGALDANVALEDVAKNLSALSEELLSSRNVAGPKDQQTVAEQQLRDICDQCKDITQRLLGVLADLRIEGPHRKWDSFRQALTTMWKQPEIHELQNRLDGIRRQLDTVLLVCLQDRINELAPSNKPWVVNTHDEATRATHTELVSRIRENNWQPDNLDHLAEFSSELDRSTAREKGKRFAQFIRARLEFPGMPDRHEGIREAHRETFKWIYQKPSASKAQWSDFVGWLENTDQEQNVYWITGKAGSGKSTLMKFLYNETRTKDHLQGWADQRSLTMAGFFFWNSGSAMQMSRMGLLRTLILQMMEDDADLPIQAFPGRWELHSLINRGLHPWTWQELKETFMRLLSDPSRCFCFFIDGLDEFDGNPEELVQLALSIARAPNAKICVASRPSLVFEDAFKGKPSLLLEWLTRPDIQAYVSANFRENKQFIRLLEHNHDFASQLENDVVEKSSGVFLWVYLVVNSLLDGIRNSDRIADLQRRLEDLPSDLEELFNRLLNSVEPFYFQQACHMIEIARVAQQPPDLLVFDFATESPTAALRAAIRPMSQTDRDVALEDARRRLKSRCKGFFEVTPGDGTHPPRVEYLHRTAKDFLQSPSIRTKIHQARDKSFDPNCSLASAYLLELKTLSPADVTLEKFWDVISWGLEYSIQAENTTGQPQVSFLDELNRVAAIISVRPDANGSTLMATLRSNTCWTDTMELGSFLELAVLCDIRSFVSTKLAPGHSRFCAYEYEGMLWVAARGKVPSPCFQGKGVLGKIETPNIEMIKLVLDAMSDPSSAAKGLRRRMPAPRDMSIELDELLLDYAKSHQKHRWYHKLFQRRGR